jgi:hypothetical protein
MFTQEFWNYILISLFCFYNFVGLIIFFLWGVDLSNDEVDNPSILQFIYMTIICGPVVTIFTIISLVTAYGFVKPAIWVYKKLGKKKYV